MHMPTFGQVATIGMALFAAAAIAAPVAQPLEADVVERSAEIVAFAGIELAARGDLEQRNKKKCKRTNNKGYCTDSDDDKKDKKKKQCKRNKKGDCYDSDNDKKDDKKGNQKDDKKDDKKDNKKDDKKDDKKGHY
ncbi:Protein stu1 [Colletotrichum sp. SAR 10_96]|nr:Protein stu1 [Colletotrichum sp. SAR 10_96]